MKSIEVDDELYAYIASQTKSIGESASDILRRLLMPEGSEEVSAPSKPVSTPAPSASVKSETTKQAELKKAASVTAAQVKAVPPAKGNLAERVTTKTLNEFDKKVDKFLFVLSQLYQLHQDSFAVIEEIRGKDRLYFATSEASLTATGKSTNPKSIPESPYWVVTNNNSEKKTRLLSQAMSLLGYEDDTIRAVVDLVNQ